MTRRLTEYSNDSHMDPPGEGLPQGTPSSHRAGFARLNFPMTAQETT